MQYQTAGDPTAVMGRRIGAYILDSIIIMAIFFGALIALGSNGDDFDEDAVERTVEAFALEDFDEGATFRWDLGRQVGGFITIDRDDFDGGSAKLVEGAEFWLVTLVGLAASLGFLVFMQGATGKTPGKAAFGVTTVAPDGSPPGLGKAIVRWLLLFVDAFLLLPGLISSLTSKGHRRIGDMAAKTYVVRRAAAGQPVVLPGGGGAAMPAYAAAAPAQPSADAQWDPSRQAWIRWDGAAWAQHDPNVPGGWRQIS